MSSDKQGKVEIKIGNVIFSAEGNQEWLSEQLAKVMEAAAPAISGKSASAAEAPDAKADGDAAPTPPPNAANVSLASYLRATGGDTKQIKRFLATAAWLFKRGTQSLTSTAVATALSENHQKRLANPADCLNQNTAKGYCEKKKDGFFITPEGWASLGEKVE